MPDYGQQFFDGIQRRWNAHSIEAAERCLRYYQYSVIEGWHKPGANVHLFFGGLFAESLEKYYLLRAEGADREEAIDSVVDHVLRETWIDGKPWESEHNLKTRYTLVRTLVWYFEEYKDDLPILQIDGKPAVEVRFELEIDNDNTLIGTLDRIVDYNGDPFVMDQKTTGSTLSPYFFKGFSPNTQMSAYTFAGSAVFASPIKGVVIDGVQVAVGFTRFARAPTYRSPAQLQEWYDNTMHVIERAQTATREGFFPMNTAACSLYGGCPFRGVCSKSPEVRRNYLKGDYAKKEVL